MKRAVLACIAALTLCSACIFDDIGFEDCDCDEAFLSSTAGN